MFIQLRLFCSILAKSVCVWDRTWSKTRKRDPAGSNTPTSPLVKLATSRVKLSQGSIKALGCRLLGYPPHIFSAVVDRLKKIKVLFY